MQTNPVDMLTPDQAALFLRLALEGIVREFPNKPDHVLADAGDIGAPRQWHPAFYGSYDWHSAVHGHWLLLRLLRRFPAVPRGADAQAALAAHLTASALLAERDYAARPGREAFERPYGWAWVFALASELDAGIRAGLDDAAAWSEHLSPLVALFRDRLIDWLPRQRYPVRAGTHANTAFMLDQALAFSLSRADAGLAEACRQAALRLYAHDRHAAPSLEPSGNDFLSPILAEAVLMQQVLAPGEFKTWLERFVPGLDQSSLMQPVDVTDRLDAQGGHLDGLNLSRAWHLQRLAAGHAHADALRAAAAGHRAAAIPHVASGHFLGEHWLATFATMALDTD